MWDLHYARLFLSWNCSNDHNSGRDVGDSCAHEKWWRLIAAVLLFQHHRRYCVRQVQNLFCCSTGIRRRGADFGGDSTQWPVLSSYLGGAEIMVAYHLIRSGPSNLVMHLSDFVPGVILKECTCLLTIETKVKKVMQCDVLGLGDLTWLTYLYFFHVGEYLSGIRRIVHFYSGVSGCACEYSWAFICPVPELIQKYHFLSSRLKKWLCSLLKWCRNQGY